MDRVTGVCLDYHYQSDVFTTTLIGHCMILEIKLCQSRIPISTFTQRNGLLSDNFEKLEYDKNKRQLILSSDKGISLIDETIPFIKNKENKIYINRIFINNQRYNKHNSNNQLKSHGFTQE